MGIVSCISTPLLIQRNLLNNSAGSDLGPWLSGSHTPSRLDPFVSAVFPLSLNIIVARTRLVLFLYIYIQGRRFAFVVMRIILIVAEVCPPAVPQLGHECVF